MPITVRYACPGCGAGLEFDSKLQKMKCPYCDSVFSVSDFVADTAAAAPKPKNDAASGFGFYRCSGCGAEVIADKVTAATNCPYCSNPIILTGNVEGQLMPDYIIPFKISLEEAKALAEAGTLVYRLLPPDYALAHLKRADIPARLRKPVINGAKLPLVPGTEDLEEKEPVRIYLEDRFRGIAARRENELIWKALIAPEEAEETD